MENIKVFNCPVCGEKLTDEENKLYNGFCKKCDGEGWHYCEKCGKPTKHSVYNNSVGGLVCENCNVARSI